MPTTILWMLVLLMAAVLVVAGMRIAQLQRMLKVAHVRPLETLTDALERVQVGDTKQGLARRVGVGDHATERQWVYYLDIGRRTGYVVEFDSAERVTSVASWVS